MSTDSIPCSTFAMQMRRVFAAALFVACALLPISNAAAQNLVTPSASTTITPQTGDIAFLVGHAVGTQGYVCLPTAIGASWTVNNSRPEATLFVKIFGRDVQVITHFLSPDTNPNGNAPDPLPFGSATWQSSFDSSAVWAKPVGSVPAGSEDSCPNSGAIPCLLLQSIGSRPGPAGGRSLMKTTYIQRLNTSGGVAPATGCSTAADVSKQVLVPYTADYVFFHGKP